MNGHRPYANIMNGCIIWPTDEWLDHFGSHYFCNGKTDEWSTTPFPDRHDGFQCSVMLGRSLGRLPVLHRRGLFCSHKFGVARLLKTRFSGHVCARLLRTLANVTKQTTLPTMWEWARRHQSVVGLRHANEWSPTLYERYRWVHHAVG
jgi:hypothetical protein